MLHKVFKSIAGKRGTVAVAAIFGLGSLSACGDASEQMAGDTTVETTDNRRAGPRGPLPDLTNEQRRQIVLNAEQIDQAIAQHPPQQRRGLTSGESEMLATLFGEDINTTGIEILSYAETPGIMGQSSFWQYNSKYIILRQDIYEADFTDFQTADRDTVSLFVRLFSMLNNNRSGRIWAGPDPSQGNSNYTYQLDPKKSFTDYSIMQRALMMDDYMRNFVHPESRTNPIQAYQQYRLDRQINPRSARYVRPDVLTAEQTQLIKTIEDHVPAARELRLTHMVTARRIHQDERQVAAMIFGDELDTSEMWLHFDPYTIVNRDGTHTAGMVFGPDEIFFFLRKNHSENYSRMQHEDVFGVFMHELAHNWQIQTEYQYTNEDFNNNGNAYNYPLDPDRWSFGDYGTEQQASLIGDYARLFLHHGRCPRGLPERPGAEEDLQRVVERRFPQARQTRLYFEQNGHLPGLPRVEADVDMGNGYYRQCSHPAYRRSR